MNKNELYSDIRKLIDRFCSVSETKEIMSYSDKVCNFEGLLEQFNGIVIPIIQRDYAQGRNNFVAKDIRKDFLNDLYNAIDKNKPLYLDFIYGNVNSENQFEPLDGQQRLTTLFLLHLYLYKKAHKKTEQLEKFSYKTRISSKEFLKTITQKLEIPNELESIKNYIENSSWFLSRWKLDPTVQACLNMLEDIHSLFYKNLDNNKIENINKITFKLLDIGELNLSDDLYIKMNSRGKSLTDFENLKAQIIDYLKKQKLDPNEFSDKLDNELNDFIWEKIKKSSKNTNKEMVDIVHIRIVIAAILKTFSEFLPESGILQSNEHLAKFLNEITNSIDSDGKLLNKIAFDIFKKKEFEEIFSNVLDNLKNDKKSKVSSDDYNFSHRLSPDYLYKNLTEIYEQLYNYDECVNGLINETKINYNNKSLISINDLILFPENKKPSYSDYIMFLGQTYYLEAIGNNKLCSDDFKEWIRFLRNLTARSYISSSNAKLKSDSFVRDQRYRTPFELIMKIKDKKTAKPFESFIQQNLNILEDNDEIEKDNKITAFLSHEKKKIEYLRNNSNQADNIYSLENNILFRGNLEFIFSEYIDKNIPIDLEKLAQVMNKCFNVNKIDDDFRMAFLTVNNNAYDFKKNHHNCYTFNENWQKVTKYRLYENYADIQWCMSPKEKNTEKYILENFKSFFDELIKYCDEENPFECIIDTFLGKEENKNTNDWRYRFIKQYKVGELNDDRVPYIVIYNNKNTNEFKVSYLRLILPRVQEDFYPII